MNEIGKIKIIKGLSSKEILSRIAVSGMALTILIIATICTINALKWVNKPFPGFLFNRRLVVSTVGQNNWTGIKAGLKEYDRVLAVNGQKFSSLGDFKNLIKTKSVGDLLNYSIDRRGKIIQVAIPTMRFTWLDFLITFGITFSAGIIYLLIGIIVFIMKPDKQVSWAFLLACFFLSLYTIVIFDISLTHYGFIRVYLLAAAFFPATFVHLGMFFPEPKEFIQKHPKIQVVPYTISLILVIPMELIYPDVQFLIFWKLVTLYMVVSAILIVIPILYSYFKSRSIMSRQRAKVVLFGSAMAFPIPALAFFSQTLFGSFFGINIPGNLLTFLLIFFPASIAYAITKHNLFDVDVYIKRTVGYGIMTAVVGLVYFTLQTFIRTVILTPIFGESAERVYPILFALLIVFFFNPVNRRIQAGVDKLFYRKKFDYKETLDSLSHALTSVLNLNEIVEKVIHTVRVAMFIDTAGVILLEPQSQTCQSFFVGDGPDDMNDQPKEVNVVYDDPLLTLLSKEKKLITKYDIDEDPRFADVRESCGLWFEEMAASIAIPLLYQEEIVGVLALGYKKSGHFYSREEIDLLGTLAHQSAIAMENAKLFEEHLEKGRMEEELKIARNMQMSMLPETAPSIEGFAIAARSTQAREVGGDFYDFIEIGNTGEDKKLGIVVGDVSGKAVTGALVMAASRSVFRLLAGSDSTVEEVMRLGNQRLQRDIEKRMFVALIYAVLSPKEKTLTLSNAGQTQPIICSGSGSEPGFIETTGDSFPLGLVKNSHYEETVVSLKQGDTIVFYSDGVVEAMNEEGALYGFERFLSSIDEARRLDADAMRVKLNDDIARFVGDAEPHDDLTIVVLKVEGKSSTNDP